MRECGAFLCLRWRRVVARVRCIANAGGECGALLMQEEEGPCRNAVCSCELLDAGTHVPPRSISWLLLLARQHGCSLYACGACAIAGLSLRGGMLVVRMPLLSLL
eukprot:scaffold9885_cov15-Tisochrysis_lutea.AAC.1